MLTDAPTGTRLRAHVVALWPRGAARDSVAGAARAAKYAGAFMEDGGGARALAHGRRLHRRRRRSLGDLLESRRASAGTTGRSLLLMHSERFGNLIDRDFAAYAQPSTGSLFGGDRRGLLRLSAIRLGVDDIPFTNHLRDQLDTNGDGVVGRGELRGLFDLQDQIRYKSDQELALMVSYGERLGGWRIGGTVKFIRQSVGDYSSLGIGADLALLRRASGAAWTSA